MKKKFTKVLVTAAIITTFASVPVSACTPRYKPVSTQSWYINLQKSLAGIKNIKIEIN